MAVRREQLYALKAQYPTDTAFLAAQTYNAYYGGMPLEITSAGAKKLIPTSDGHKDCRKLIGISVNSSVEDAKYGNFTPYFMTPCILALYDGAASPFIAGAGDYPGPGRQPAGGSEVYGPYGLGTGLTTGEGKPFLTGSAWVVGGEVTINYTGTSLDDGKWMPATSPHYSVGVIRNVIVGGGANNTAPDIVEIQFHGGCPTAIP